MLDAVRVSLALKIGALSLLACGDPIPPFQIVELAPGESIKMLNTGPIKLRSGEPAIIVSYETDVPLDDRERLRAEAQRIWEHFAPSAEERGARAGVISVFTPERPGWERGRDNLQILVRRDDSGDWAQGEERQPPGVKPTGLPALFASWDGSEGSDG